VNFAPTGPVATGLIGARADLLAAELHVLAIDPCVACSVAFSTD
jgi:uptake hydrogenase large subunit